MTILCDALLNKTAHPIQVNRVNRYVPFVSSRAAGARKYVPERREKDVSDKHSVVKQFRQNCGSRRPSGNNDTCVGYTSQSRTPLHKNGGRHENPMERLAHRRLFAFDK